MLSKSYAAQHGGQGLARQGKARRQASYHAEMTKIDSPNKQRDLELEQDKKTKPKRIVAVFTFVSDLATARSWCHRVNNKVKKERNKSPNPADRSLFLTKHIQLERRQTGSRFSPRSMPSKVSSCQAIWIIEASVYYFNPNECCC